MRGGAPENLAPSPKVARHTLGRGEDRPTTAARYVYAYRFTRHRIAEMPSAVDCAEAAYQLLRDDFEAAETERLIVVLLNRKHRPIGI